MRYSLKPHPATPCDAVSRIDVEVSRREPHVLDLRYRATGRIADLRLPARTASVRTDELWRHTCFEAFAATADEGYTEFNLSPSTAWAAYRFTGYRAGMAPLEIASPRIEVSADAGTLTLHAMIDTNGLAATRLGLTAVIEEATGRISYWALAHPAAKPDFHHSDGFALNLGPHS